MAKGKKRNGGEISKVSEAARINIRRALERFQSDDALVYNFEEVLTTEQRALVHTMSSKLGMISKSTGKGSERRISVTKLKKKKERSVVNLVEHQSVAFSPAAREVLEDLFTHYPPTESDEGGVGMTGEAWKPENNLRKRSPDEFFIKPSMSKQEIAAQVKSLASRTETDPMLKQLAVAKSKLPIAAFRDEITSTVESNQVVLISGETGCGKTTQVPQYLLDHMWGKGKSCKVVCTQPRRISSTSVANRIASERGEQIGENVGYKIRLESKGGKHSSIMFCTNGILLRVLVSTGVKPGVTKRTTKDGVRNITHIIVDEIHERDHYSDFMLAILRDMLPSYPDLRVILMSATLDAELFSQYFGGCPILRVPGFTYPVRSYYLEDVLSLLKSEGINHLDDNDSSCAPPEEPELTEEDKAVLDEAINLAWLDDEFDPLIELVSAEGAQKMHNYQQSLTGLTALMVFAYKGSVGNVCTLLSLGADCHLLSKDGLTALQLAEHSGHSEISEILNQHMKNTSSKSKEEPELLDKYLSKINPELIDIVLIEKLLMKISKDSQEGAILVFLPGWDEINKTRDALLANSFFNSPNKFEILSLHSMIPGADQGKVFSRVPPGFRKIVLSTNIAETAITIDDVVFVVDSGRLKEKSYDPHCNVSTLQSSWVSKASARQREGRAGRCQPGICYHLFSKKLAASLPGFQVPEMRRIPVEELCLQVKLIDPGCTIIDFLQKTLDPPLHETVRNAVNILQDIGALTPEENLTELGVKLGSLPLHPVTSKMLFFAILMKCLDPALTLACYVDFRSPFTLPMLPTERKKANDAKAEFSSLLGGHSDQLAVVAAFDCWRTAKERDDERRFCEQYFVSPTTMSMLSSMRLQLQKELIQIGLIPENVSQCSLNARDPGILNAVLLSGLYPMVGRLLPPLKPGRPIFVETSNSDKVRLHPGSTNYKLPLTKDCNPLIMYDEVTRGDSGMHIRNCTLVGPVPLLFLSTEIAVALLQDNNDDSSSDDNSDDDSDDENKEGHDKIMSSPENPVVVVIDRWLRYQSTALDVGQLYLLRERLSAAILFKVKHPTEVLSPVLDASVHAIACIISSDGLSGIALPPAAMDSLTKMVNATKINNLSTDPNNTDQYLRSLFFNLFPQNSFPQNIVPQNIVSRIMYPQNIIPQNIIPQNIISQNIVPQNIFPQNIIPQNIVPQNIFPQNIIPQNIVPQNIFSRIMYPQNIIPQNMYPQIIIPHNMYPQIIIPQNMFPQNMFPQNSNYNNRGPPKRLRGNGFG